MKLNYKIFGSGPPLIILHGLFGMLDNWRTIAKMLDNKYQCILVDLRNHGRSPHDEEMNYEVMSRDILELMNDMHLEHTMILGHSMGGKVAMQFSLMYPEKVDKLIVVDIAPKKYRSHHNVEMEAVQSVDPTVLKNRSEAEEAFALYLGDDMVTIQFLLKNLSRLPQGGFEWKANMPVLIANYDKMIDAVSYPNSFTKPALFIRGENSNSLKEEDWSAILPIFPKAKLITIEGAGHWVHADQPEALTEQLEAFLG